MRFLDRLRFPTLAVLPLAGALLQSAGAAAQTDTPIPLDAVNVTGYALDLSSGDNPGATVDVVTRDEIVARQYKELQDALKDIPALAVSSGGTRGAFTQLRLRGAESNQTLVLVDGVPVNMVADSDFDLSAVQIEDVQQIQVIEGAQSGLYGAGAHAGVIAITTISGKRLTKPLLEASTEVGFPNSRQASVVAAGTTGLAYGAIDAGGDFDGGFNASAYGSELDPASAIHGSVRVGADLTDTFNVEGFVRGSRSGVQTDPTDFTCYQYDLGGNCTDPSPTYGQAIDGNNFGTRSQLSFGGTATAILLNGAVINRATASRFDETYTFAEDGVQTYRSTGVRTDLSDRTTYRLPAAAFDGRLSLQVDHQSETFSYVSPYSLPSAAAGISRSESGVAAEFLADVPASQTNLALNARYDEYSLDPGMITWRAALSQTFGTTRFHASVGTGSTEPTFYEQYGIFGNFVGNPDLTLEHSLGWDAGAAQSWGNGRLTVDATIFEQRLRDEIATTGFTIPCAGGFCSTVVNLDGTSLRRGVELTAQWQAASSLTISAAYTFIDSRDPSGAEEVRRPHNSASADIDYQASGNPWSAGAGLSFTGPAFDVRSIPNAPFTDNVRLPGYLLASIRLRYVVDDHLDLSFRVENLSNAAHEDIYGYPGPGRSVYVGARATF